MSSTKLSSFRDDPRREDIELYLRLCSDLQSTINSYTQKPVTIPSDLGCHGTLEERLREAHDIFDGLMHVIIKETSDLTDVRNRFAESFASVIKVDFKNATSPLKLNDESIAQMSEAECKRALLVATRTIEYAQKTSEIISKQALVFVEQFKVREKQIRKWDKKASELAREAEKRIKKMKSCSKRLDALVSTSQSVAEGKPLAQAEALTDSVAAVEKLIKAERENVKLLEGRLAEAEKQLEATRASLVGSSPEIDTLQDQLRIATQNGQVNAARAEELEEKLRCSLCMDRPKNVAFACGHTCCDRCASEWKRCSVNCKGPKSQKPVKHSFPLYL